ncbi:hypothetical protein pVco7_gp084 [Vibrio phage pVco-7]|uniref:Uncharacterized protein n=1 Tax=Vibrio phage pVco-5 TaxID=1965485 RepID=A0A1W6JUY9_9CAUD|nr:hypothetical protein KNT61_gp084 [Vibrio phage pVco-5]ARM71072.1 hypothetical protein pVco5_084 [Vibrio phage pVco-5]
MGDNIRILDNDGIDMTHGVIQQYDKMEGTVTIISDIPLNGFAIIY